MWYVLKSRRITALNWIKSPTNNHRTPPKPPPLKTTKQYSRNLNLSLFPSPFHSIPRLRITNKPPGRLSISLSQLFRCNGTDGCYSKDSVLQILIRFQRLLSILFHLGCSACINVSCVVKRVVGLEFFFSRCVFEIRDAWDEENYW
ncbi:hypothetical protein EYC80_007603 [Monilinia laxa]|uniref:Uncharacterized protein n=1 Tax=Monilinia laxa TaxID=61186 RepID=A0A5N6JWE9_MONLA|nr:hypothetical protein EYC80_007603 [Monilinia laxa]